ncbi:MAG: hypothetical protein RLZZ551_1312, partial [Actinomycetota bacterium]
DSVNGPHPNQDPSFVMPMETPPETKSCSKHQVRQFG